MVEIDYEDTMREVADEMEIEDNEFVDRLIKHASEHLPTTEEEINEIVEQIKEEKKKDKQ